MVPEDHHYMQVEVPREAFEHDFLLHGILGLSALEAASEESLVDAASKVYFPAALEYYEKASESFRTELYNIMPENHHSVYVFAIVVTITNMAIPQFTRASASDQQPLHGRMAVLFEFFIGASSIALTNWGRLMNSPVKASVLAAVSLLQTQRDSLDASIKSALERLTRVVDAAVPKLNDNDEGQDAALALHESYRKATSLLQICFVEDAKDSVKGFCISFPMFAGHDFALAFRDLKPIANCIVMHWGVLLDRLSNLAWWAKSVGCNLVQEISNSLLQSRPNSSLTPEPVAAFLHSIYFRQSDLVPCPFYAILPLRSSSYRSNLTLTIDGFHFVQSILTSLIDASSRSAMACVASPWACDMIRKSRAQGWTDHTI